MSKRFATTAVIAALAPIAILFAAGADRKATPPSTKPVVEYRVMGLVDLFGQSPDGQKKIGDIMVHSDHGVNRTDMDAADYQEAFNRMAREGWEVVAPTTSNYWVFRRPAQATGG